MIDRAVAPELSEKLIEKRITDSRKEHALHKTLSSLLIMSSVKQFDYGKTARLILPASYASLRNEDVDGTFNPLTISLRQQYEKIPPLKGAYGDVPFDSCSVLTECRYNRS